jgi:hypothetical protein
MQKEKTMPDQKTIVVSIISPGVARGGDGFVIINGKLRRIPPNSPKLKEIESAVTLMAQQENITDRRIRSQLGELSESLLTASVKGLVDEAGK